MAVSADPRLGQGEPTGNGTAALASELFQQHSAMVLAICRRLLVDPAEAEDAMQQTFLHAYRSLLAGREPRQPAAWLASIARNECLNRIRARTREPATDELSNGAAGSPDALNAAIASEDLRALGHTINRLPTHQREALLLHEFCGLRYDEVAAAIGVSESAIGSLLFRARSRLRFLLQRAYGLLPVPWLWDLARTPGVKVAALPAVAKVGTAAVAVSLATGSAVVIEHEVQAPKKPATPPAQASAAPARSTMLRTRRPIGAAVTEKRPARSSSPTIVPVAARHIRKVPPAKKVHKIHRIRPAVVVAAGNATAQPASYAPAAPPGQAKKESSSASARSQSARTSTGRAKSKLQHGNGRSSAKVTPPGQPDKQAPARSTAQGSPNGNAWGNGDKAPNANASGAHDAQLPENGSAHVAAEASRDGGRTGQAGNGVAKHEER